MNNNFIPQAVEIVKQAIDADNAGDYERALPLYRRSLEYFMTGLKYEQNPAGKLPLSFCTISLSRAPNEHNKTTQQRKLFLNEWMDT